MNPYLIGCDILGASLSLGTPSLHLDPLLTATAASPGVAPALSAADLAALDRKLTPEEQAKVDAYQAAQANAAQSKEEAAVYTDPATGKKVKAKVAFAVDKNLASDLPTDGRPAKGWSQPGAAVPATSLAKPVGYVLGAAAVGVGLVLVLGRKKRR
jgi:hypothetical protein